jgi:AraC-like DNA-binding protein/mannose-6-phosphate isomerase-like protein (cupin superfamily)
MVEPLARRAIRCFSVFAFPRVDLDSRVSKASLVTVTAIFQPFPMLTGRRAQIWRHRPEYRRPRHFHDEPELNVVVAGSCELGVGDRVYRLSAGQMVLFQPGQDHVLLQGSDDLDLFVLALSPELADRALGPHAVSAACGVIATLPAVEGAAAELCQIEDGAACETQLADRFAQAKRRASSSHVLARRAVQIAREEPSVSGAALARRLSTAPSFVSRRFHTELGVPLVEYRARMKLMRFIALVDSGHPLTRAALDAEFGSYAQCHRVFRRAVGCSPSEYFAGARQQVDAATIATGSRRSSVRGLP